MHTSPAHIFEVPALMNGTSSFLPLAVDRCLLNDVGPLWNPLTLKVCLYCRWFTMEVPTKIQIRLQIRNGYP